MVATDCWAKYVHGISQEETARNTPTPPTHIIYTIRELSVRVDPFLVPTYIYLIDHILIGVAIKVVNFHKHHETRSPSTDFHSSTYIYIYQDTQVDYSLTTLTSVVSFDNYV